MASWFRSWHGAPTDNKWLLIAMKAKVNAGTVSAIAWALFDYASQADDRGSVQGFDVETYAAFSGFDIASILSVVDAMKAKNVIGPDGRLTAWDKRQPKREDDSSERVKRYRQQQKANADTVTQCNATSRSATHGNNTDTDTDTDTEAETETTTTRGGGGVRPAPAPPVGVTIDPDYAAVADAYHKAGFGTLSIVLADTLKEYLADYGRNWTEDAIVTAARSGKLNLNYVGGILRRWKANGKDTPATTPHTNGNGYSNGNGNGYRMSPADRTRAAFEEVERMLAEQEEQERKAQGKGKPE